MQIWVKRWRLLPVSAVLCVLVALLAGSKPSEQMPLPEDNIQAIPLQLERDSFGLAMIDKNNQTIWLYEITGKGPAHSRLKLIAARSWKYDRLLQQYNTDEPKPEQVRALVKDVDHLQKKEPAHQSEPDMKIETSTPSDSNDVNDKK